LEDFFQREIDVAECGVTAPSAEELAACRALSKKALGGVGRFVLLVGGHDPRKNAAFAISLTPALAAMGLRLVVTVRRDMAVFRSHSHESTAEITVIEDPSDAVLWGLYAEALAVLQPSEAEGFGLPLLEAAAVGTPFISTDVGVARRLAVDDRQVLPLDSRAWEDSIEYLLRERPTIALRLGEAAKTYTWYETAKSLLRSCEAVLARSS
jgi:glycosyltransferase involved in cell wall biosynthesis